jgi:hypothetical protein
MGARLMAALALGTVLLASPGTTPVADDFTTDNLAALPISADLLEGYVGEYQLAENSILSITRDGLTLFGQLTGFKRVALQCRSGTVFFHRSQSAQITFVRDSSGLVTMAFFRQNGNDFKAPRVDASIARQINSTVKAKSDSQESAPGAAAGLSGLLEEIRIGDPDYSKLSPAASDLLRRSLGDTKLTLSSWGPLQSIRFIRVDRQGWDVYQVQHEHHRSEWRITMTPTGLVGGLLETRGPVDD